VNTCEREWMKSMPIATRPAVLKTSDLSTPVLDAETLGVGPATVNVSGVIGNGGGPQDL